MLCNFVTKPVVLSGELLETALSACKDCRAFLLVRFHVRSERMLTLEATGAAGYTTGVRLATAILSFAQLQPGWFTTLSGNAV